MQSRANKKQSCKDKESQGKFAEYPIFFRHLPLRRKCGRLLPILCRDKEPVTGTWRMTLGLPLQRKNMSEPLWKRKMARITAISDWYWPWMHEHCQNEKSLCGRFNHQLQASLDKEANEKIGRDQFVRYARLPGTAARLTLEKRKEHKKSRDQRQSHKPSASKRNKKQNR